MKNILTSNSLFTAKSLPEVTPILARFSKVCTQKVPPKEPKQQYSNPNSPFNHP